MNVIRGSMVVVVFLLLNVSSLFNEAHGQQTVFNVPTTDVLEKGKVYFELDISVKPNASDARTEFTSLVPRILIGTGARVEVGLNLAGNIQPGSDATTLVPTVKWKTYENKNRGLAIAVGNHMFIPLRNKSYRIGTHSYVVVQKSFRTRTRLGFGGGVFTKDVVAPNAIRGVGQFSVEQEVTARLGLALDWYTGKHANGYWTAGGNYKLTSRLTIYVAYSVGNANASRGNHFFYSEFCYNFN